MRKSTRRTRKTNIIILQLGKLIGLIIRLIMLNPLLAAFGSVFCLVMIQISVNALFQQPHAHRGVFLATRAISDYTPLVRKGGSSNIVETKQRGKTLPSNDLKNPMIARIQRGLKTLNLYEGIIDGVNGPLTRKAIEEYQQIMGLPPSGNITPQLLELFKENHPSDDNATKATLSHIPTPDTKTFVKSEVIKSKSLSQISEDRVKKAQLGLQAFGNDDIKVDGVYGEKTRKAILEFQIIFGLKKTGEIDDELIAKMREIDLIN